MASATSLHSAYTEKVTGWKEARWSSFLKILNIPANIINNCMYWQSLHICIKIQSISLNLCTRGKCNNTTIIQYNTYTLNIAAMFNDSNVQDSASEGGLTGLEKSTGTGGWYLYCAFPSQKSLSLICSMSFCSQEERDKQNCYMWHCINVSSIQWD